MRKAKAARLKFKPVLTVKLTRTASPQDQFETALRASDHLTLVESAHRITFTLRKRRA